MDPAELRFKNFIQPEQFPYKSPTGWEYDSGNYPAALQKALDKIGYQELLREQAEKRARGELMGIGISTFTEIVGAGPSHTFDILGIKMFDSAEIRVHPTGSAIVRIGVQTQGQGHETTFAQIVADELGLPVENIIVEHGDTDTAPYGLGTYASRSTPTAGAATAWPRARFARKRSRLPRTLLEVSADDLEWVDHKFQVKGAPELVEDNAGDRLRRLHQPSARDGGRVGGGRLLRSAESDLSFRRLHLRRRYRPWHRHGQDPPLPGHRRLRHGDQPDDRRGPNPRRPDDGAWRRRCLEEIVYDENGNNRSGTFMDYLLPTAMETPSLGDRPHRSRRRHIIPSAPRASASRQPSVRRRPSPTRWWMRCRTSACGTSTSRSRHGRSIKSWPSTAWPSSAMDWLAEAHELATKDEPFALATVVRRVAPASAQPGAKAVIRIDGSMHGWVGGSCAQPVVISEAHRAMHDGAPRLLRLGVMPGAGKSEVDVVKYPMTCHSGGALEILIEPVLPVPRLAMVGETPVVEALAELTGILGYRVSRFGRSAQFESALQEGRTPRFVVVASMGDDDEASIGAALRGGVPYVALVASPRRAATVRDALLASGVAPDSLTRLKSPAGLDIGARTQQEIALSILAEIVQMRAAMTPAAEAIAPEAPPPEGGPPTEAIDPVCGMTVAIATTRHSSELNGKTWYFCCGGCQARFEADPAHYATA